MNHELLRHVDLREPNDQAIAPKEGIVLCPQFREKFNLGFDAPTPRKVYMEVEKQESDGEAMVEIDVVGELTKDLPEAVEFLMSESVESSLFSRQPRAKTDNIETTKIDPHWLSRGKDALYELLNSNFGEQFKFEILATDLDRPNVASLRIRGPKMSIRKWVSELDTLSASLDKAFELNHKHELKIVGDQQQQQLNRPIAYHYLGLYFNDPLLLPEAADFLEENHPVFQQRKGTFRFSFLRCFGGLDSLGSS